MYILYDGISIRIGTFFKNSASLSEGVSGILVFALVRCLALTSSVEGEAFSACAFDDMTQSAASHRRSSVAHATPAAITLFCKSAKTGKFRLSEFSDSPGRMR